MFFRECISMDHRHHTNSLFKNLTVDSLEPWKVFWERENSWGAESSSEVRPFSDVGVMTHFHSRWRINPKMMHAAVSCYLHVDLQMDMQP
jgi:hypothetical protein